MSSPAAIPPLAPPAPALPASSLATRGPCDLIAGEWIPIPGATLITRNPAHPSSIIYSGAPQLAHVDSAVRAARAALPAWSRLPRARRFEVLHRFAEICKARQPVMAGLICDEIGKAMWESAQEAGLLHTKVDITLDAAPEGGLHRVTDFGFNITPTRAARCTFKPHGVMAVLGPFNFPAHLPNGHIIPALALGNTVVFKPSDKAAAVGQELAAWLDEALRDSGVNIRGVVNLVQGGADIAAALVAHEGLDAIAFTGSWAVGKRILQANLDRPGRIIALELGGNNATVILPDADLRLAAIELARCAFTTTGQRCTCTRRVLIHRKVADKVINAVTRMARELAIGDPRAEVQPFIGPINNEAARAAVFDFQSRAQRAGAEVILESKPLAGHDGWFLSPSILRVDRFTALGAGAPGAGAGFDAGCDEEVFGPMLRIAVVDDLDDAIAQTNASRYGLAAAIFSGDPAAAERFTAEARAGCINVNTGTAGASSKLPFGGLGLSGNHRPAGSFALDYCATPVATMIETATTAALPQGMKFEEGWLA